MAEYQLNEWSGMFNAMLVDGKYDRVYNAEHFAGYFANFISSGVFADPSDQLKVRAKEGLTVSIKAGKSYIKGYAHNLISDGEITFSPNMENVGIINKVCVEYIPTERDAHVRVIENAETALPDNEYQLVLCSFTLPVGASEITDAMIIDRRPDKKYCGFVTGLVQQIDFTTLMEQEKAQFAEWFEAMKGQLSEDAAGNLQTQIDALGEIYLPRSEYVVNGNENDGYVSKPGKISGQITWSKGRGNKPPRWHDDWRTFDASMSMRQYDHVASVDIKNAPKGFYFSKFAYVFLRFDLSVRMGDNFQTGNLGYQVATFYAEKSYYYNINDVYSVGVYNQESDRFPVKVQFPEWHLYSEDASTKVYYIEEPIYHDIHMRLLGTLKIWFRFIGTDINPDKVDEVKANYKDFKLSKYNPNFYYVLGIYILKCEFQKDTHYNTAWLENVYFRPIGIGAGFDPSLVQNDSFLSYELE